MSGIYFKLKQLSSQHGSCGLIRADFIKAGLLVHTRISSSLGLVFVSKGLPANLQALLPEAGETVFLEGPPGSGKTTIARILVSSWTEGPTHALSNILDLSAIRLLLHVDCSAAMGDLFQEISAQLSLLEVTTEEELRTELTGSSDVLLLLGRYREGSRPFDESLKKFLSERRGCRVLVTACPGHCPILKDTVGTGRALELQIQTVIKCS